MSRKIKHPVFDEDNPEWTKTDFAAATKFPRGLRLKNLKPAELARIRWKTRTSENTDQDSRIDPP